MAKLINLPRQLLLQWRIKKAIAKRDGLNTFSKKKYAVFVINDRKVLVINKPDFQILQRKYILRNDLTWGDFKRKYEIN